MTMGYGTHYLKHIHTQYNKMVEGFGECSAVLHCGNVVDLHSPKHIHNQYNKMIEGFGECSAVLHCGNVVDLHSPNCKPC